MVEQSYFIFVKCNRNKSKHVSRPLYHNNITVNMKRIPIYHCGGNESVYHESCSALVDKNKIFIHKANIITIYIYYNGLHF